MAEHVEDWPAIIRWLQGLGLTVVSVDAAKRQLVIQLPPERD